MAASKKRPKAKAKVKAKVKAKPKATIKAKSQAKAKAKLAVKAKTKSKSPSLAKSKAAKKSKPKTAANSKSKPQKAASRPVAVKASSKALIRWAEVFTPLDDRLVVQVSEDASVTPGGIIIPTSALNSSQNQGQVLLVGRGHRDPKGRMRPMDVSVGDQVLFPAYAGSKLKVMGHEVLVLREGDVLGIVES